MNKILFCLLTFSQILHASLFSTDIDGTFKSAKKDNLPILIAFSAIWCPPCNDLEETVYESSGFLQRSRQFKLLKVDADATTSFKIKDKYKVGGYPTIVFVNPNGEEIYRFTGYREPQTFFNIMDVAAKTQMSLENACKSKTPDDLWRCGVICREKKDSKCAMEAFKSLLPMIEPASPRALEIQTYFAGSSETPELKKQRFEALMNGHPGSALALDWVFNYLSLKEEKPTPTLSMTIVDKVLAKKNSQLKDPAAKEYGLTKSDVHSMRARLLTDLGRKNEANAAWTKTAEILESLLIARPKAAKGRAINLELIFSLIEAEQYSKALKLSTALQKDYPEEFTFHYLAAASLNSMKKTTEALPLAKTAYKYAYGDNKIRSATLLVKLLGLNGDKAAAEKIYKEIKNEFDIDDSMEVRTHRYLKKLDEQWAETSKA